MEWLAGLLALAAGSLTAIITVLSVLVAALVVGLVTVLPIVVILAMLPQMMEQARRREAARLAVWGEVAQELGGTMVDKEVTATVDGRALRVAKRVVSSGNNSTSTYTDVHVSGLHPGVELVPQHFLSGLFGATDHQVGDKALDDALVVGGDEVAIGLLGASAREMLRRCPYAVRVSGGWLRLTTSGAVADGVALRNQVQWARRLGAALSATPDELAERLSEGAAADPVVAVRVRFLTLLRDRFPAAAVGVAERLAADPEAEVRVVAAQILGRADTILEVLKDPQVSDSVRLRALEALPPEGVDEGVRFAVSQPDAGRLWRAAARLAPAGGTAAVASALSELAPRLDPVAWPTERGPRGVHTVVAREVAAALGRLPFEPAAEALLCTLLTVDDGTTQQAAIDALREVGTVGAVPALNAVIDGAGILSGLGGEARKAVRAIQARSGGARGGLSMATGSAGALAVADAGSETDRARLQQASAARDREAGRG